MAAIDREARLKLVNEGPVDPRLPICDPHHHLWDYPDRLPESAIPMFARHFRRYQIDQLLEDTSGGHNIRQTVFIECNSMYTKDSLKEMAPVGETEFVQGIAAQSASGQYGDTRVAAGIVGFAELTTGHAVEPVLEAHISTSRNRFRGLRYISTWHTGHDVPSRSNTPHLLSDVKFREGFGLLHKYGLSFDSWLYHTQLGELISLARAFPDTTIILDHIGGPLGIGPYRGKQDDVFQDWKQGISDLSRCQNVFVKLGGLGMPMFGFGWHERPLPPDSNEIAAALAPYFDWCINRFGADRCMFESNFPVDKVSYSYTVIWNAFKRFARNFSPAEKSALFYNTAVSAYRLA